MKELKPKGLDWLKLLTRHHIIYQLSISIEMNDKPADLQGQGANIANVVPEKVQWCTECTLTVMKQDDFNALSLASIKRIFLNVELNV